MKHQVVADYLRIIIDQNKFSSNTKLPSEIFLTKKFSVCRETVRLSIKQLEEEGLVYSVKGSGTFYNKEKALSLDGSKCEKKYRIALIVQGQDRGANSSLVKAVKETLKIKDVDIRLFYTDNKISNERKCLTSCKSGFDGIIIDGVKASIANPNLDVYASLYNKNVPLLFYNNYYAATDYPKIIIDDVACADLLVKALVDKGHKYISGIFFYDNYQGVMKYQGYVKALLKYNAVFDDKYVKFLISDNVEKKEYFEKVLWNFLKTIPRCSAIVCCNIMIYEVIKRVLSKHNLNNYSIVCFDYSTSDYKEEGVTCSLNPGSVMGNLVAETIIEMIEDPNYKSKDYSRLIEPMIYFGNSIKQL